MPLTPDEEMVIMEALREYRLRLPVDNPRRVLTDALIFRLVDAARQRT